MKRNYLHYSSGKIASEAIEAANEFVDRLAKVLNTSNVNKRKILAISCFLNPLKIDLTVFKPVFQKLLLNNLSISPPVSFVLQPPANNLSVIFECLYLEFYKDEVSIDYFEVDKDIYSSSLVTPEYTEFYFSGITANNHDITIDDEIETVYRLLDKTFSNNKLGLHQIIRQWNYLEKIVAFRKGCGELSQHYQLLNNIRHKYYSRYMWENGYPAATGIGMESGGFVLDCIALHEKKNLWITPISNPDQVSAHQYSPKVLVGSEKSEKDTPKFERAKLISYAENQHTLYVSGTAAIIREASLAVNNAAEQTRITLHNIDRLIEVSVSKLTERGKTLLSIDKTYLRAYIKNENDIDQVVEVCNSYILEGNKVIYLMADVCRDELLVEIEGVIEISTE